MEGDFRRPARRPDAFMGGRPLPQTSQRPARPIPVTDLRHQPAPAMPTEPDYQPRPAAQPVPQPLYQPPAPQSQPLPEPQAEPAPRPVTTAELIARHERETAPKPAGRRNLILAAAGLLIVVMGAFLFTNHPAKTHAGPFPSSISSAQITIPVYYPSNLPVGYKITGYKVVKQDTLNYAVTNTNNDSFYVDIQPIPPNYDFAAFNKRFSNPISYETSIGTAMVGLMNNQLIGSIQTAKSWVLINSTALKATADLQTITKALKPVSL